MCSDLPGRPALELDARGNFLKNQPSPSSLQIEAKYGRTTGDSIDRDLKRSLHLSDHEHLSLRHNRLESQTFSVPFGSLAPVAASQ